MTFALSSLTNIISYYLTLNIVHWLTCLFCYRYDDKKITSEAFTTTFMNVSIYSIPAIYIFGSLIPNLEFSLIRTLIHLAIMFLTVDLCFYTTHYIFHNKYLYRFHKVHHEYKYPVAMVALYCHWMDFYFNNIFPIAVTGLLLGSDLITMNIWLAITTFNAIYVSHSGRTSDKFHLLHHVYVTCNYGIGFYMDKLLITSRMTTSQS